MTEVGMIDEEKVAMRMKMQSFCSRVNSKTEKNEQSIHMCFELGLVNEISELPND